ncbi:site-specific DNA-methyltransferase [Massilia antarctica]|uniref:site-specific DNA-methyltransferase n=1 Tax=Massilia antarctica TaxID=2765360 RepID=UPI0022718A0F|nr:site-specific DNA-methyltransferase [Massilia sp. H27-R4]MCY0910865.1 site-specific DNA-methyltransferase [Massilia sp. H27-R4]
MTRFTLHLGDCIEVMRGMADASVDSIVTDPPYELSNDGKQSASRVFFEFAFPENAKIKSHLAGGNALPLFIDKVLGLGVAGDLPRPSSPMPIIPVALNDEAALGKDDVKHTSESAVLVSSDSAVANIEAEPAQHLGCFALKLADPTKLFQILNGVGAGFVSSGIGIGLSGFSSSLPCFNSGSGPIVLADENVGCVDGALTDLVRAFTGAGCSPVLGFDLGRGAVEVFSANGARLFAAILLLSGAQLVRASPTASRLPAMLEARRVSVIDDLANRAFTFDLIVHEQGIASSGFMGKQWDGSKIAYNIEVWAEALRVLKPGGHLLAFGGTRTQHRMVCAIEDAGFEIRDQVGWLFGSGFPKSLNVSKAIDGHVTNGRSDSRAIKEVNKTRPCEATVRPTSTNGHRGIVGAADAGQSVKRDTPATPEGEQWEGWGTALKPAWESICVARKPLAKGHTVAANVLAHGTGALNIDGCRVGWPDGVAPEIGTPAWGGPAKKLTAVPGQEGETVERAAPSQLGRWPANIIHDGSDEVLAAFPDAKGQLADASTNAAARKTQNVYGAMKRGSQEASSDSENEGAVGFKMKPGARRLDSGSAARFFYCAKTSSSDRHSGLEHPGPQFESGSTLRDAENLAAESKGNHHPTVKPTDLMAYLVRLITPPGGKVLDMFMGSGSTGKACMREGFQFVGIDKTAEYLPIAQARIEHELAKVTAAADLAAIPAPQLDMFAGEVA